MTVKPVDLEKFSHAGIYEAIIVVAKRARQIHNDLKIELSQRLETLAQLTQTVETDDEIETGANPDQLKISLEFEKRRKPAELALQEMGEKRLTWRKREEEQEKPPQEEPEEETE